MCFYSAQILSCVRDFHISHTLVNHNWTVVTQRMNSKYVCFQFEPRGPAKAQADSETTPQIYRPHHLVGLLERLPCSHHNGTHTSHLYSWGWMRCGKVSVGWGWAGGFTGRNTWILQKHTLMAQWEVNYWYWVFKKWLIKQFSHLYFGFLCVIKSKYFVPILHNLGNPKRAIYM